MECKQSDNISQFDYRLFNRSNELYFLDTSSRLCVEFRAR